MKSVTVTVDDRNSYNLAKHNFTFQRRNGDIDRKTTTNKRMFRKFVQEYIDLKLKKELLDKIRNYTGGHKDNVVQVDAAFITTKSKHGICDKKNSDVCNCY